MTDAIDVRGLNKSFGDKHVVRDVSIQVGEGRITGFLGPNGAGKTTTLRLLCGLLTPDSGEGEVLGLDFRTQTAAIKRQTGYMTQSFSLYQDMTIEENLGLHRPGLRPRRPRPVVDRGARRARAATTAASSSPARSRAAGSNASRWPRPRSTSPGCCCSTSPRPGSTRRQGASSGTKSTRSPIAA